MANSWAICRVSRARKGRLRVRDSKLRRRDDRRLRPVLCGGVFNYEQYMARVEQAKPTAAKPNGSVFIGSKGMLTTGTYGENTRLIPVAKMEDYKFPPELLTRSPGHYRDWIRACKGGDPACSNFSVSAPFTETILLGVLALRFDGKLEWDAAKMRVTNNQDANKFLKPVVRKGWSLT